MIDMKSAAFLALSLALIFLIIAPSHVAAQEVAPEEVIKVNTDLVVIDAQVIKKNRQVVGDLRREDFELYEDGARREIGYFSRDELPLSVVLLLDVSGSVRSIVHTIAEGAHDAMQRLKPEDEVAVMAFANSPELVQGFTRDRRLIAKKIEEASRDESVGKGTFLTNALWRAAQEARKSVNPTSRRVVIVVTDNIAALGGKTEVRRATEELLDAGAVVYGLIVRGGLSKTLNVMTLGLINAVDAYSEPTGGEIMGASKNEVDTKLGEMFARLRTRYSLGFKTPNTTEDGLLRRLKLQLTPEAAARHGKVTVVTKEGYYFRRRAAKQTSRASNQRDDEASRAWRAHRKSRRCFA
jgi:VWFA-related protein